MYLSILLYHFNFRYDQLFMFDVETPIEHIEWADCNTGKVHRYPGLLG